MPEQKAKRVTFIRRGDKVKEEASKKKGKPTEEVKSDAADK